jgi:hypothetical protein
MPGDPTSGNDEELLSQIDELKARMDRLMRGGTSTSNSALLTDAVPPEKVGSAAPPASQERTRVRDLIGPADTETVEVYPGSREDVGFSDDEAPEPRAAQPPAASVRPPSKPVGGSVVDGAGDRRGPRASVASFDQLGSAVEEELARDVSVPAPEQRKGPDLASRFGPADEATTSWEGEESVAADDPAVQPADPEDEAADSADEVDYPAPVRSGIGLLTAIWVLTALLSGAIAALHFTGVI